MLQVLNHLHLNVKHARTHAHSVSFAFSVQFGDETEGVAKEDRPGGGRKFPFSLLSNIVELAVLYNFFFFYKSQRTYVCSSIPVCRLESFA